MWSKKYATNPLDSYIIAAYTKDNFFVCLKTMIHDKEIKCYKTQRYFQMCFGVQEKFKTFMFSCSTTF